MFIALFSPCQGLPSIKSFIAKYLPPPLTRHLPRANRRRGRRSSAGRQSGLPGSCSGRSGRSLPGGRSLAPRERSVWAGSGERSRPHPAESLAGAPAGRRSLAQPERRGCGGWNRTTNLPVNSRTLYQFNYPTTPGEYAREGNRMIGSSVHRFIGSSTPDEGHITR